TANRVIHLRPLVGAHLWDALIAANPFVARFHPNAAGHPSHGMPIDVPPGALSAIKTLVELALGLPAPIIETVCRRLYARHLRRRAASWQSPEQVQLRSDYLKL